MPDRSPQSPRGLRRRTLIGAIASVLAASSAPSAYAHATRQAARQDDECFMHLAIQEALRGDYHFGAVIVKDGLVLASGHNSVRSANDPTAHGEIAAIRNFTATHSAKELQGATLYTSAEPCAMCMGAIVWSGFGRLVYAASIEELSARFGQIQLTSEAVAQASPFARIEITGGVLAGEALMLFQK
jgi:tRNA(adenine34) deaminase